MKIGPETIPRTSICTSDEDQIVVRGRNLCRDLIGKVTFTQLFHLLLTGREANPAQLRVLDATLAAIAEHGMVPSVQAARMTFAAAPESLQGGVAAGLLGCGSVILGAAQEAGALLDLVHRDVQGGKALADAAVDALRARKQAGLRLPGYGHPEHKRRDPRVDALFEVAREAGTDLSYAQAAQAIEQAVPEVMGRDLRMNVSVAIPAVLLGIGFPLAALRGVPLLARTASLIAHLAEEMDTPSGFALSYQATRELEYLPQGRGQA